MIFSVLGVFVLLVIFVVSFFLSTVLIEMRKIEKSASIEEDVKTESKIDLFKPYILESEGVKITDNSLIKEDSWIENTNKSPARIRVVKFAGDNKIGEETIIIFCLESQEKRSLGDNISGTGYYIYTMSGTMVGWLRI